MKWAIILSGLFFSSSFSWAGKINYLNIQCPSAQVIANYFLETESVGYRHLGETVCSKKIEKKIKNVMKYRPSTLSERLSRKNIKIISSKNKIKILSIKISKEDPSERIVRFRVKLENNKTIIDKLSFSYFKKAGSKGREYAGCGAILDSPKYYYVTKSCLSKRR